MTSSLVGSEMCIRDSPWATTGDWIHRGRGPAHCRAVAPASSLVPAWEGDCLLYTSDAADDM
eukprot:9139118-Prorocentrum_lima.AAC.1